MFKGVSTFENPKNSLLLSFWLVWLVSLRGWYWSILLKTYVTEDFFRRDFSKKLKKRGGEEESNIQKKEGQNMNKKISKVTVKNDFRTTKKGTRKGASTTTTTPRHKKTLTLDDQRESLWSSVSWFDRATKAQTWSFLFDAARVSP